jgi:hypothetical protein
MLQLVTVFGDTYKIRELHHAASALHALRAALADGEQVFGIANVRERAIHVYSTETIETAKTLFLTDMERQRAATVALACDIVDYSDWSIARIRWDVSA